MTSRGTLVCVHAHPDDEAIFTSGLTLHYAEQGYRVVLVTCTMGQLGIDGSGRAGNVPGHDDEQTRVNRAGELQRAATLVGYDRALSLGYRDSGMRGWPQNDHPDAFVNANVEAVADTLAAIFNEVNATVVVTYDENGFYGHPDHVQANVVTRAAVARSATVERLYYPVLPSSVLTAFVDGAAATGLTLPAFVMDAVAGVADEDVEITLNVNRFAPTKQEAIRTHASQIDNADLMNLDPDIFAFAFGTEFYQRAWERRPLAGDGQSLFGNL